MVHWYPMGVNFQVYASIFNYSLFLRSYGNTILYTIVGTAINVLMTVLCAYPLSRKELYGRNFFTAMITFTMFFSGGLIPSFLLVNDLGLRDSMWALLLPGAISTYNMIVMRTSFQSVPAELHESAYLDGANDLTILVRIILPLSGAMLRPSLFSMPSDIGTVISTHCLPGLPGKISVAIAFAQHCHSGFGCGDVELCRKRHGHRFHCGNAEL